MLSRGIMLLSLAVLVFLLINSMQAITGPSGEETTPEETTPAPEETTPEPEGTTEGDSFANVEKFTSLSNAPVNGAPAVMDVNYNATNLESAPANESVLLTQGMKENEAELTYDYDASENGVSGYEGNGAGAELSQLNNRQQGDTLHIEGTDLLMDINRFVPENPISNVNRNASNDLRGDIPIEFNANFTPFYQSAIHGEPLTARRLQ